MSSPQSITGTSVVPGVGTGLVVVPGPRAEAPADEAFVDADTTVAAFAAAASVVAERLTARAQNASGSAAEVLQATAGMARDPGLAAFVKQRADRGPAAATTGAVEALAQMFTQAGGLMAERVTDLHDVRDRVVAELLGVPEPGVPVPDEPSVLFADDLAPADTAGLDPERIVAIAIEHGGSTSHTAIIARQLGIPCVVGVAGLPWGEPPTSALVDGTTGEVSLDPDPVWAREQVAADAERREAAAGWSGPAVLADGHRVQLLANVQDAAGARVAAEQPIEGFGLYRTELSFLDRSSEPTVEEQTAIYGEVLTAASSGESGAKVVVRTLDAGSDKPLAFADMGDEPNPALGVRGLRIARDRPDLLDHQLDAIAAAASSASSGAGSDVDVWVMAPMVAVPSEAREFASKVRSRGLTAGVMIETPSAAVLADRILAEVDFVSVGTNDLSQYTFAADRMASELSDLTDPWQPGLLAMVQLIGAAGTRAGKPVGVCGEAAADPLLGCVLVGLGVTSLSCAAPAVRAVGAQLAAVTLEQCQAMADAALAADSPADARAAVSALL